MSKIKIYRSSAGSGKTYILVLEYIKCLLMSDTNNYFQYILTVSFTKDATNEIKERILSELYGLAMNTKDSINFLFSIKKIWEEKKKDWKEEKIRTKAKYILHSILQQYSQFHITTIDSFFQQIIHNLSPELGYSNCFDLEMDTQQVLEEAVSQVIEKATFNRQIFKWLILYAEQLVIEGKNYRIEEALKTFGICIYNEFFQEHINQLPSNFKFFSQLKKEQEYIKKNGMQFFKIAYKKVIYFLKIYGLNKNDFIRKGIPISFFQKTAQGNYFEDSKSIKKYCSNKEIWIRKDHKKREIILSLTEEKLMPLLNLMLVELRKVHTAQMILDNLHQFGLIKEIIIEIGKQNHEKNRFVLSNTNIILHQKICKNDASFIYEKIGHQIKHVMIDEFQDTSQMQWKNFRILLDNIIENNLFSLIVGDEKQSIYRWRNSDYSILQGIKEELNAKEKYLSNNWRSEKNIVDFNNIFFNLSAKILQDKLGDSIFSAYTEEKIIQKVDKHTIDGYVSIELIQESEKNGIYREQMLKSVLNQVQKLYEKCISPEDICLLVRKNKTIRLIAEYFATKKVDYTEMGKNHYLTIISNEAFYLKNSLSIKIITASFKMIIHPDNLILQKELSYWLEIGKLSKDIQGIDNSLLSLSLFDLVGYLCRKFKLEQIVGESAYLFAFYDYLIDYSTKYPYTIQHFLECWENEGKNKSISTKIGKSGLKGIQAMTIHKSKGLQFHSVIIPFCDWGLNPEKNPLIWCQYIKNESDFSIIPITYKKKMEETIFAEDYKKETIQSYIDNLNLLYVAFTRAEKNLIILSKYKKKIKEIGRVSDIIQGVVCQIKNKTNDHDHFEIGTIFSKKEEKTYIEDNFLKQVPIIIETQFFHLKNYLNNKIFKRPNQFKKTKTFFMDYGNIMHSLFAGIDRMEDISSTVENGILHGLIPSESRKFYIEKIHKIINESGVKEWFSKKYIVYKEFSILSKENGIVVNKRPDRILISKEKTIVIDYKFGKHRSSHKNQLKQYINLLKNMDTKNVEGYLWYVENNEIQLL